MNPNMYLTIIGQSYYCQVHVRIRPVRTPECEKVDLKVNLTEFAD